MKRFFAMGISALAAASVPAAFGDAVVFSGTGTDAEVTVVFNQFRDALGPLNPNVPGSLGSGRREINWDAVPDSFASPNAFPPDFFNGNAVGRARGVVFATPGSEFQVSADSDNPTHTPINFANINPQYGGLFRAFSPERMFAPIGSITTMVSFFVPGTNTPATVSGFGAIFSDEDTFAGAEMIFLSPEGRVLAMAFGDVADGPQGGASFVGVHFNAGERVARVAIFNGVVPFGPDQNEGQFCGGECFSDAIAMDDFVYGEPVALASPPCAGDADRNGQIDLGDLSALLSSFGLCIPTIGYNPLADIDANGCVDLADLASLLARFGSACP